MLKNNATIVRFESVCSTQAGDLCPRTGDLCPGTGDFVRGLVTSLGRFQTIDSPPKTKNKQLKFLEQLGFNSICNCAKSRSSRSKIREVWIE